MEKLFFIKTGDSFDAANSTLLMEISTGYLFFGILSADSGKIEETGCYTYNGISGILPDTIFEKHPGLSNRYMNVIISYWLPDNILVPEELYKHEDCQHHAKLIGGYNGTTLPEFDKLTNWNVTNVYNTPPGITELFEKKYSSAKQMHFFSSELAQLNRNSGTVIKIDFKPGEFSVIVLHENKLILTQMFEYNTAEDILYHLLKICQSFNISQYETELVLSGFIDMSSPVFDELNRYFIQVSFAEVPDAFAPYNEDMPQPSHFFSSLYNLALCVS